MANLNRGDFHFPAKFTQSIAGYNCKSEIRNDNIQRRYHRKKRKNNTNAILLRTSSSVLSDDTTIGAHKLAVHRLRVDPY